MNRREKGQTISIHSTDSGVLDMTQNNSFLWNIKDWDQTCHEQLNDKTCSDRESDVCFVTNVKQSQHIDEHIYEELYNCHSLSPNEWIDIDFEDKECKLENTKSELYSNRKSQNFRSNNYYRKSFRPKLNKRKTFKTGTSLIKSGDESVDSGSATEYEDIEEDYDCPLVSDLIDNRLSQMTIKSFDELNSQHIYEEMSDQKIIQIRNLRQMGDNRSKLLKQLSNNLNEQNKQGTKRVENTENRELLDKRGFESEPNIYTSTPRRLPALESNLNETHKKRDSLMSRNSSIYINPNYCPTNYSNDSINSWNGRSQMFEKQLSVTASIASYLEFNGSCQDQFSPFISEPLYQFYQKDVRRRAQLLIHFDENLTDLEYDEYENNTIYGTIANKQSIDYISDNKNEDQISCDRIQSLCKRNISTIDFMGSGPNRSLWCQLPQVLNSKDQLLTTLSDKEKRFQESMFEIIASEASYCKSLNVLVSHFCNCNEFRENNPQILSLREKNCLFSNIEEILKISCNLLKELEKRFEQNILLYDVCDIVYDYAVNHFQPYIHYCAYQRDQEKLLTKLTHQRTSFVDVLRRLESNQICQNQNLLSFLMLPMQVFTH